MQNRYTDLDVTLTKEKQRVRDLVNEVNDSRSADSRQKLDIQYLQDTIKLNKEQALEKNKELDKALLELDTVKDRLANLNQQYDFASVDQAEIALAKLDDWGLNVNKVTNDFWRLIESTFECGLCH